jgi:glucoamylase
VSAAALSEGAGFLEAGEEREQARSCRAASEAIRHVLDGFWLPGQEYYRSRVLPAGTPSTKELDIAVILAAIHAAPDPSAHRAQAPRVAHGARVAHGPHSPQGSGGAQGANVAHGPHDPRILATLKRLETLFAQAYPINRDRPAGRAPAMGRYAGDLYFSGGAYYFSTLGAAELCFRTAAGREDAPTWVTKGDAFLATVRAFTPPGGELSEQFDQRTGSQTSARHLAWSYAAFISCVTARRVAVGRSLDPSAVP